MRIVIETKGQGENTKVTINGKEPPKVTEFNVSVRANRPVKVQIGREGVDGKPEVVTYYGGDIEKYDEYRPEK